MNRILIVALGAGLLSACGNPMNLSYDFGRSYSAAFQAQADLSRPSVAAAQYRLSGMEGTQIRIQVEESAGDQADERQQSTQNQGGR